MRYYLISIIFIVSFFIVNNDVPVTIHHRSVIDQLEKDGFYKELLELKIYKSTSNELYSTDYDSIIYPRFSVYGNEVKINEGSRYGFTEELKSHSIKDPEKYLRNLEEKYSKYILFMYRNGITEIEGNDSRLFIDLGDEYYVLPIQKRRSNNTWRYEVIDRINNWIIYKKKYKKYKLVFRSQPIIKRIIYILK